MTNLYYCRGVFNSSRVVDPRPTNLKSQCNINGLQLEMKLLGGVQASINVVSIITGRKSVWKHLSCVSCGGVILLP